MGFFIDKKNFFWNFVFLKKIHIFVKTVFQNQYILYMINDKKKIRVIDIIDKYEPQVPGSVRPDLKRIREKYIYKDINDSEFANDITFLRQVRDMIKK